MNQREAFRETLQLAIASAMPEGDPADPLSLAHLRDMHQRLEPHFSEAKIGRWLGWAQCALVAADVGVTLDDVKAINLRHAAEAPQDHLAWVRDADVEAIPVDLDELPSDLDEAEPVDESDLAWEVPEFSDFEVWCTLIQDWAYTQRPQGQVDSPWFCRHCGATNHQQRDHESEGA